MSVRWLLVVFIVLTGAVIAGIINIEHFSDTPDSGTNRAEENRLVVINPKDVNPTLVDSSIQHISEGHVVGNFSFENQLGHTITQDDSKGKIYVANFFFTTCGGICPKMTRQLKRVQEEFRNDPQFLILSHTVNPSIDSAEVLFRYARRFEIDDRSWWFLTGSKEALYKMARRSYLLVPDEKDPNFEHGEESDFIHTENVALVDPKGRIRGIYDGTNESDVSEMIRDIYDLKKEFGFK